MMIIWTERNKYSNCSGFAVSFNVSTIIDFIWTIITDTLLSNGFKDNYFKTNYEYKTACVVNT